MRLLYLTLGSARAGSVIQSSLLLQQRGRTPLMLSEWMYAWWRQPWWKKLMRTHLLLSHWHLGGEALLPLWGKVNELCRELVCWELWRWLLYHLFELLKWSSPWIIGKSKDGQLNLEKRGNRRQQFQQGCFRGSPMFHSWRARGKH